jgi:cilia- and flagella-associated protein 57
MYPAGSNIILYNIETKQQRFIHMRYVLADTSEKSLGISCLCLSSNKRYLAVGEKGEKPVCIIYDLQTMRKRKVLTLTDGDAKEFISISFSADAKFLLTQTGAPDWSLTLWGWEKSKVMTTVRYMLSNTRTAMHSGPPGLGMTVSQVSINPNDPTQICVTGHGIFKVFRYTEGNLKLLQTPKFDHRVLNTYFRTLFVIAILSKTELCLVPRTVKLSWWKTPEKSSGKSLYLPVIKSREASARLQRIQKAL